MAFDREIHPQAWSMKISNNPAHNNIFFYVNEQELGNVPAPCPENQTPLGPWRPETKNNPHQKCMWRSLYKVCPNSLNLLLLCRCASLAVHVLPEVLQQLFNSWGCTIEACAAYMPLHMPTWHSFKGCQFTHVIVGPCWCLFLHDLTDHLLSSLWVYLLYLPPSAPTKPVSGLFFLLHTGGKWSIKALAFTGTLSIHLLSLF